MRASRDYPFQTAYNRSIFCALVEVRFHPIENLGGFIGAASLRNAFPRATHIPRSWVIRNLL